MLAYLAVTLRVEVFVISPLDSHHDLQSMSDRDVGLVVVRGHVQLVRTVRQLKHAVEVPWPDRVE